MNSLDQRRQSVDLLRHRPVIVDRASQPFDEPYLRLVLQVAAGLAYVSQALANIGRPRRGDQFRVTLAQIDTHIFYR